jgi:hypothetical protein
MAVAAKIQIETFWTISKSEATKQSQLSDARRSDYAQVAQLVEQRTENPRVGGSNPPLGTTFPRYLRLNHWFLTISIG